MQQLNMFQRKELDRCAQNPIYFIQRYIKTINPIDGVVSVELYEYQKRILRECHNNNYNIIKAPRQVGKTMLMLAYSVWLARFGTNRKIHISTIGTSMCASTLRHMIVNLPSFMGGYTEQTLRTIHFDNGSVVSFVLPSAHKLRATNDVVDLMVCDEFAFTPNQKIEGVMDIFPHCKKILIASAPNSDDDKFAQIWLGVGVGFKFKAKFNKIDISLDETTYDENFKRNTVNVIGANAFKREYECQFLPKRLVG